MVYMEQERGKGAQKWVLFLRGRRSDLNFLSTRYVERAFKGVYLSCHFGPFLTGTLRHYQLTFTSVERKYIWEGPSKQEVFQIKTAGSKEDVCYVPSSHS